MKVATGEVELLAVATRADDRAFRVFPFALHRNDPHWVAPLRAGERRRWRAAHNASLRSRSVVRFLARRSGRVVGRIAAVVDPAFVERWRERSGFFGFFECEENERTSLTLLRAVERVLRDRGMRQVLGPVNLSTHDEVGLLVDGFDRPPTLLSPYNPPYYERLVEGAGFVRERDYEAWLGTPDLEPDRAGRRLVARAAKDDVVIRQVDPARWNEETETLRRLYNHCFAHVWGFVPMTRQEFMDRARTFRTFYRPELILIAERAGAPSGFALFLPDVNRALAGLGGRLLPFGWLQLARRARRLDSGRVVLLGVAPDQVGRGLAVRLVLELAERAGRLGFRWGEASLIDSDNRPMRRVVRALGLRRVKTYRLYRKSL